jgi:hypothetical protein
MDGAKEAKMEMQTYANGKLGDFKFLWLHEISTYKKLALTLATRH